MEELHVVDKGRHDDPELLEEIPGRGDLAATLKWPDVRQETSLVPVNLPGLQLK